MKPTDQIEYEGCSGTTYFCNFVPGFYGNGNLALELVGATGTPYEGEPIVRVTVNPGYPIPDGRIAIKDYSENKGMVDFCKKAGIIGREISVISMNFVTIPVYELTESGKEIFSSLR